MKFVFAALLGACLLPAIAPRALAQAAAPVIVTAKDLRESMLASDSIQVARVEIDVVETTDSTGNVHSNLKTKRVSINQVKGPWMKRFVANFLPEGDSVRDEMCPAPVPTAGSAKPWMVSALWINKTGRGQAYLDFSTDCAFAGLAGRKPAGIVIGAHADSLFALFQQALYADSALKGMKLGKPAPPAPPTLAPMTPGASTAPMPPPGGSTEIGSKNAKVLRAPLPRHKVAPEYPGVARDAKVEGTVMVSALVGADGTVKDAKVQTSIPMLDSAALDAVRQWTFMPATDAAGTPVEARVVVPVKFKLQTDAAKPQH
jgi:TonB family protein